MDGMCPVCGDLASAHLHYGTRVCYNCRGFFRRCVLAAAKGKTIFSCPFKCGNCKSCRYEKCLVVGMRPTWVETETSGAKRKLSERSLPRRPRNLMEKFTRDEYALLLTLFDSFCHIMAQEWLHLHKKSPLIFSEFWSGTLGGRILSYNGVQAIEHINKEGLFRIVYTLMGKGNQTLNVDQGQLISCIDHNVSSEDIRTLLEHNIPLLSSFKIAGHSNTKNHHVSQYFRQHYWREFERSSYEDTEVHNLRVTFGEEVCLSGSQTPSRFISKWATDISSNTYFRYDQIYDSPWASNSELEDRHKSITGKIHTWMNDNVKESTIEEIIVVHTLLEFILIFSADFVDGIKEPIIIQRQQQVFCHLLYKYLKARHGSAKAWIKFGGAVMISSYVRELRDIETKRLRV